MESELGRTIQRHPEFAANVHEFLAAANDRNSIEFALLFVTSAESSAESVQRYRGWLDGEDSQRTRIALNRLTESSRNSFSAKFPTDLQVPIARALERLAKAGPLESKDIYYMQTVAEHVPDAVGYTVDYIDSLAESSLPRDGSLLQGVYGLVRLLRQHPEELRAVAPQLRVLLKRMKQDYDLYGSCIRTLSPVLDAIPQDP
ncbi:MAG: hypothetical protein HKN47_28910 [Pirellulaceae bacterium]|nr:hypothetical protein [Pirellulaceae bacterium]